MGIRQKGWTISEQKKKKKINFNIMKVEDNDIEYSSENCVMNMRSNLIMICFP